jgi:hypothetical protein
MGLKVLFCDNDHFDVCHNWMFVQKFNGCKLDLGWNCLGIGV